MKSWTEEKKYPDPTQKKKKLSNKKCKPAAVRDDW